MGEEPPHSKRPRLLKQKMNLYHECEEIKNLNPFRLSEFRLKEGIFVSQQSGANIPNPVEELEQAFSQHNEFFIMLCKNKILVPRPLQSQGWPIVMSGQDLIGIGAANSGKTLTFLLPVLLFIQKQPIQEGPTVLVLSPTQESASQIKQETEKFRGLDIKCACLDGDDNTPNLIDDRFHIIAATAEQLENHFRKGNITSSSVSSVSCIIIEKADEMLAEEQRKNIDFIIKQISPPYQIIITSTTWCDSVKSLSAVHCPEAVKVTVDSLDLTKFRSVTQEFEVVRNTEDKVVKAYEYLRSLRSEKPENKIVVFCNNEMNFCRITSKLSRAKILCQSLGEDCKETLDEKKFDVDRLIITDKADLELNMAFTHILNLDFPKELSSYVKQIQKVYEINPVSELISFLSQNEKAVVPDVIAILRETNQKIQPMLFDLASNFETVMFYEDATFEKLVSQPYYIDKSLIIADIITKRDQYLFTAPRKMGKTAVLRMLQYFFTATPSPKARPIFENLKIGKRYPDLLEEHFGRYPVLWIDMSDCGAMEIDSPQECENALRRIISATYSRYSDVPFDFNNTIISQQKFQNYSEGVIDRDEIRLAIEKLARLFKHTYKKQVVLCCDEFDAICDNALSRQIEYNTLDSIIRLYFSIFTSLVKSDMELSATQTAAKPESAKKMSATGTMTDSVATQINETELSAAKIRTVPRATQTDEVVELSDEVVELSATGKMTEPKGTQTDQEELSATERHPNLKATPTNETEETEDPRVIFKAIFSGIAAITCSGASPLNTLSPDKFLESATFSRYYGVLKSEYEELLNKPVFERLRDEKELVLARYNGYESRCRKEILSTYSICNYLANVLLGPEDRLKNYWQANSKMERFTNVWAKDNMLRTLQNIVHGQSLRVQRFDFISSQQLAFLSRISATENFPSEGTAILTAYVQQLGFFAIIHSESTQHELELCVPNQEVKKIFSDLLAWSVLVTYELDESVLNLCAKHFNELANEQKRETALKELEKELSFLCKSVRRKNDEQLCLNEATFEHITYAALLKTIYSRESQTPVENPDESDRRKWYKIDLCFYSYRESFGVVAELKFGKGESAEKALVQIYEKKYYKLLNEENKRLTQPIRRKLFLGMHVNEDGQVTILPTDDIINYYSS